MNARVRSRLAKLRGRSFAEVRVRGMQTLTIAAERIGLRRGPSTGGAEQYLASRLAVGVEPHASALLDSFRHRAASFPSLADHARSAELLRDRWPDRPHRIVEAAERALLGRFDLLGRRDVDFGSPPDWRLDPVTGLRTPLVHWSRIDHLDPAVVGEYKLTWELSRHQHFLLLGQAYLITGDERFARGCFEQLGHWHENNPAALGMNWSSSLEVAFRAISWTWALQFFRGSCELTPARYVDVLASLDRHARHIESFLSTYFSPNTHITGEALGLLYVGLHFPELERAGRWRDLALRILREQLPRQVRADGVYFEQSTYYSRYTADFYLHLCILARSFHLDIGAEIAPRLQALLDFLVQLTGPDGSTPLLGDDDGGRLLPLDGAPRWDFRSTLAVAAAFFRRTDYRYVAGDSAEDVLWLMGAEGLAHFDAVAPTAPGRTGAAFPAGGFYTMRSDWTGAADHAVIDCGPHGTLNCGHAHADALSLTLSVDGRPLLVDGGTFTYLHPLSLRRELRRSSAHNTLTLDGESSSEPAGPFQWARIADATTECWRTSERFDFFQGSHDGYSTPRTPAPHTRSVLHLRGEYWIVRDRIDVADARVAEVAYHLEPRARFAKRGETGLIAEYADASPRSRTTFEFFPYGGRCTVRVERGVVSRCYGAIEEGDVGIVAMEGAGPRELLTVLIPARMGAGGTEALAAERGLCVRVESGRRQDLLAASSAECSSRGLRSDFDLAWVRLADDLSWSEAIVAGGHRLEVGGEVVVDSATRIDLAHLRRSGGVTEARRSASAGDLADADAEQVTAAPAH